MLVVFQPTSTTASSPVRWRFLPFGMPPEATDLRCKGRLGRNDPCPCGSGRRFQALLHEERRA
jgi:uncharacterized protein YecA (UPF0149 family)